MEKNESDSMAFKFFYIILIGCIAFMAAAYFFAISP